MNLAFRPQIRIAFVVTRDLAQRNGRTPIIGHIIDALRRHHSVEILPLRSLAETRRFGDFFGAVKIWLGGLFSRKPVALQCLLYGAMSECRALASHIAAQGYDAVYLDTVRCQILLRRLRQICPDLHVVTDFDDLMSRRAAYLVKSGFPLLSGHVGPHLPRWLRYVMEVPLSRAITAYEAATLPFAEDEVTRNSNVTVLLSYSETAMLQRRPSGAKAALRAIPPAMPVRAEPWSKVSAYRFVFIGGDSQLQNRTAIDYLIALWRRLRPKTKLYIYGRQYRPLPDVEGVCWQGFVDELSAVYKEGSIALVPSLIPGGIKTKVTEAWSWGCPVLANGTALEGLKITAYNLVLEPSEWEPLLIRPEAFAATWLSAARIGHKFVRDDLSLPVFERAWLDAMTPRPAEMPALRLMAGDYERDCSWRNSRTRIFSIGRA